MGNESTTSNIALRIKQLALMLVTLVLLQFAFAGLQALAQMLPSEPIQQHLEESADSALLTNTYNYDHRILGSGVSYDNNRFISAIVNEQRYDDSNETWIRATIYDYMSDMEVYRFDYFRYWHGWQPFVMVFLTFGTIDALAIFLLILSFLISLLFIFELRRYIGWVASIVFFAIAFFSSNILGNFVGDLLLQISMLSVLFFSAIILKIGKSRASSIRFWVMYVCMISGAVFCYLDFLTVPTFALTLIAFSSLLAITGQKLNLAPTIAFFFLTCASFGIGFAFTWAAKWLLAVPYLGMSFVIQNVSGETSMWTSTAGVTEDSWLYERIQQHAWLYDNCAPLFAVLFSLKQYLVFISGKAACALLLVVAFAACIFRITKPKHLRNSAIDMQTTLGFLLPLIIVPLGIAIMNYHSIFHSHIFTYKDWAITIALLAALLCTYCFESWRFRKKVSQGHSTNSTETD